MELGCFEHLMELDRSGRIEDAIRESQALLERTSDADEKASLLGIIHVSFCKLGRLKEARQALEQMKQLEVSQLGIRLNAEFCEPSFLVLEGRYEEGLLAFAGMLNRHSEAFKEPEHRYLYEDIQSRRAVVLFGLSRYKEALPILREAVSFSFDKAENAQKMHFYLGVCLEDAHETQAAKQQFVLVVGYGLKNDIEEQALYRLAILYYNAGAFAQARQQLEAILQKYPNPSAAVPRKYVYQTLSQTCRHLGDQANAKLYMDLAQKS